MRWTEGAVVGMLKEAMTSESQKELFEQVETMYNLPGLRLIRGEENGSVSMTFNNGQRFKAVFIEEGKGAE